jgi:hypothetical protein
MIPDKHFWLVKRRLNLMWTGNCGVVSSTSPLPISLPLFFVAGLYAPFPQQKSHLASEVRLETITRRWWLRTSSIKKTQLPLIVSETVVNLVLIEVFKVLSTVTSEAAIKATIRAYSTIVAPSSPLMRRPIFSNITRILQDFNELKEPTIGLTSTGS